LRNLSPAGLLIFGFSCPTNALFERDHQPDWLLIFLQEIVEGFICEFLKCDSLNRVPRFVLKLNTLPGQDDPNRRPGTPTAFVEMRYRA
jgi:hypothetical protein